MPSGEKSLVFVYWGRATCKEYSQIRRGLRGMGYEMLARHWDRNGRATTDQLAAFDAADYRLLIDLGYSRLGDKDAPHELLARALRTGKPTIELSRTGRNLERRFPQNRIVRRVRVGQDLAGEALRAVQQDGWQKTLPWRVTVLADLIVALLGPFRPPEILTTLPPSVRPRNWDPADWWTPLSTCLALGSWLFARPHRLLLAAPPAHAWLARLAFHHSLALPLAFACLEIMSIVVAQVDILFVARRRTERAGQAYRRVSFERTLICALLNYVTIVFWFGTFYQWFPRLFRVGGGLVLTRPLDALYVSLANMSLMGADLEARHPCGRLILLAQLALGLFMALVVIAQAVGNIQHRSMDES